MIRGTDQHPAAGLPTSGRPGTGQDGAPVTVGSDPGVSAALGGRRPARRRRCRAPAALRSGRRGRDPRHARPVERENAVPAVLLGGQDGLRSAGSRSSPTSTTTPGSGWSPCWAARSSRPGPTTATRSGTPTRPRPPSWSRIRSRAAGSVRSCWSTWPRPPRSAGSAGSPPRCSAENTKMLRVFMDAGYTVHRRVRLRRRRPGVRHRTDREVPGGDDRPGAPGGGPVDRPAARTAVDRGHRSLRRARQRWAASCWRTCCAATSPGRCTR